MKNFNIRSSHQRETYKINATSLHGAKIKATKYFIKNTPFSMHVLTPDNIPLAVKYRSLNGTYLKWQTLNKAYHIIPY